LEELEGEMGQCRTCANRFC